MSEEKALAHATYITQDKFLRIDFKNGDKEDHSFESQELARKWLDDHGCFRLGLTLWL